MVVAVADTHTILWVLFRNEKLSTRVENFIKQAAETGEKIGLSSISLVEITYLSEKNRIPSSAYAKVLSALRQTENLFVEVPVNCKIAQAMGNIPRDAVPDMPDRIICATAFHFQVPLLTRDGRIRASNLQTIW